MLYLIIVAEWDGCEISGAGPYPAGLILSSAALGFRIALSSMFRILVKLLLRIMKFDARQRERKEPSHL